MHPYSNDQLAAAIDSVASGACGIGAAVGPSVGCLMATFGTSLITDCIFDFEDPEQLQDCELQQRLELWGLQVRNHRALSCNIIRTAAAAAILTPSPTAPSTREPARSM